jgi:hypothetical protein
VSISDDWKEYKDLIAQHPHAVCYDLEDAFGNKFRYHRAGKIIFAAVINSRGEFQSVVKNLTLQ